MPLMVNNLAYHHADALAKLHSRQGFVYVLIDPFAGEPTPFQPNWPGVPITDYAQLADLRTQAWQGRHVYLHPDLHPVIEPMRLPYVVQCMPGDPLLQESLDMAKSHYRASLAAASNGQWLAPQIGAWLITELQPESLMLRLSKLWTLSGGAAQKRYLRIADWRVMQWLPYVLPADQLSDMIGPVAQWYTPARSGGLLSLEGWANDLSEEDQFQYRQILQDKLLHGTRLDLDIFKRALLNQGEAVNRCLTLWHAGLQPEHTWQDEKHPLTPLPAQATERVFNAVKKAQGLGLEEADDLAQWASRSLLQGERFATQSHVSAAIAKVNAQRKTQPIAFVQALAQLEPESI